MKIAKTFMLVSKIVELFLEDKNNVWEIRNNDVQATQGRSTEKEIISKSSR
jgi:hypothetical protein